MTYRIYARVKHALWSSEPFARSDAIANGYQALEIVLDMETADFDIFIHCEETDRIYDRHEMMELAKE